MITKTNTKEYTIDAKNKRLGIIATEATKILNGKDSVNFARNLIADVNVTITNASKLDLTEKKKTEIYQTYSGYPGGQKSESLDHLAKRRGYGEVMRRTISGMLPNNKLKKQILKRLIITE